MKVLYDGDKYMVKRTKVDEGTDPKWDEILSFPFQTKNKTLFNKKDLNTSNCQINVSLFDKQIYKHQDEGKIILQTENRFLGCFNIPLQALLTS